MQCPFKLFESESSEVANGDKRTQYSYQECAMTGCVMWSDLLQDCRLALGGMENTTLWVKKSNGGGE